MTTPDIDIKGRQEQIVEARFGASVDALLDRLYHSDGMSQQQIADTLGVHRSTVVRWMKERGIQTRDRRAVA